MNRIPRNFKSMTIEMVKGGEVFTIIKSDSNEYLGISHRNGESRCFLIGLLRISEFVTIKSIEQ